MVRIPMATSMATFDQRTDGDLGTKPLRLGRVTVGASRLELLTPSL